MVSLAIQGHTISKGVIEGFIANSLIAEHNFIKLLGYVQKNSEASDRVTQRIDSPKFSVIGGNAMHTDSRKLISNAFDKMHEQLSLIRSHVEETDDPVAQKLMESMEFGLLAPMRKLRITWIFRTIGTKKKPAAKEIAQ